EPSVGTLLMHIHPLTSLALFLLHHSATTDLYTLSLHDALPISFQAQYIDGLDTRNIGEVFTLQQDLQIEKDTTYSELNLNRFSVRLEVNVEDEIPEGISYIDLSVNSSSNLYMAAPDNSAVWAITRPNMMPTFVSRKIPVQESIGLSDVM